MKKLASLPCFISAQALLAALGCTLLLIGSRDARAQEGSLDATFGNGGLVITDLGMHEQSPAMAVQPDGKILLAGRSRRESPLEDAFLLVRYLPDGRLDEDFGTGGFVRTDLGPGWWGFARDIALLPDGKILLVGPAWQQTSNFDFAMVQYTPDGTLDESFGTGGIVTTDFTVNDGVTAVVAVQEDGKIVLAGQAGMSDNFHFALARFTAEGQLDTGFGSGGKVITAFGADYDIAEDVVLQPDGKIVLAGYACSDITCSFALARCTPDGTLDPSFGQGGKVTFNEIGSEGGVGRAIALQGDGKLLVAGTAFGEGGISLCYASMRTARSTPASVREESSQRTLVPRGLGLTRCHYSQREE